MRILILAGIHGNLPAFEAVLKHAQGQWDFVWCLGNVVGYGLQANECIELLRTLPHLCVMGRFEQAVLGHYDLRTFNPDDRRAAEQTQNTLTAKHFAFLEMLPVVCVLGNYTLLHGSPRDPIGEYVTDSLIAVLNFPHLCTPYCLSGRVPYPAIFEQTHHIDQGVAYQPRYDEDHVLSQYPVIIVCGSVGISGTKTPDYAEYALLDVERNQFQYRRCLYDLAPVIYRLRAANFPERFVNRWQNGYF